MRNCDVCGGVTTWEEGTAYTADEFRLIVQLGFEPPSMITMLGPAAVQGWKTGLVANSTTGWLLCPSCARRAANFLPRTAGTGPAGHKIFETMRTETMLGLKQTAATAPAITDTTPVQPIPKSPQPNLTEILRTETKVCPTCQAQIDSQGVVCPDCGAKFEVVTRGYCATEHAVMDCDKGGHCLDCGETVIDLRVESTLVEAGSVTITEGAPVEITPLTTEKPQTLAPITQAEPAELKKCPLCAETIKAEARLCRFCGARFVVSINGYCTSCHELVETIAGNRCPSCGEDLIDVHIHSQLVEELLPAEADTAQPMRSSPPPGTAPADLYGFSQEQERPGCVTAFALFLWLGSASIAISAILSFTVAPPEISGGVLMAATLLVMSVGIAAVGVGLWQLKNWARITLIVLLCLGIVINGITAITAVVAPENLGENGSEIAPGILCGFLFGLGIAIWMITWFIRNRGYFQNRNLT